MSLPTPLPRDTASSSALHLQALLTQAALFPLPNLGWIQVSGADRVRWLNGMVTNSIQDLQPDQGCYNFILNAQGRIQADASAFALPGALLLETSLDRLPTLLTLLDRFIIMDDVELALLTRTGLGLAGPRASAALLALGIPIPPTTGLSLHVIEWQGVTLSLVQAFSPLVPRFELWGDPAAIEALRLALIHLPLASPEALEALSLLEGTPRIGQDIRDRELPQETAFPGLPSRALHFAKGCYLGQEIVERIRSRGAVHRTFTAFRLEGALPPPGTLLTPEPASDPATTLATDPRPSPNRVGEITRAAAIPLPSGPLLLALGYLRREAAERGLPLHYPGGTATPVSLPLPLD